MSRISSILSSWLKRFSLHLWAYGRISWVSFLYLFWVSAAKPPALSAEVHTEWVRALLPTGEALMEGKPWGKPGGKLRSAWVFLTIWPLNLIVGLGLVVRYRRGVKFSQAELLLVRRLAEHAARYYEAGPKKVATEPTGWWVWFPLRWLRCMMRMQQIMSHALQHSILAAAYTQLSVGDVSQNLRRAFAHYHSASEILVQEKIPILIEAAAGVLGALGAAYLNYPTENRAEFTRCAIEALGKAKRYTESAYASALDAARQGKWKEVFLTNPSLLAGARYATRLAWDQAQVVLSGKAHNPTLLAGHVLFFVAWLDWKLGVAHQERGKHDAALAHFDSALGTLDLLCGTYEDMGSGPTFHSARASALGGKGFVHLGKRTGNRRHNVHLAIDSFSKAMVCCEQGKALRVEWGLKTYALSLIGDAQAYFELEAMGGVSREQQMQLRLKLTNRLRSAARLGRKAGAFQIATEALVLLGRAYTLEGDKARAWRSFALGSRLIDRMQRRSRSFRLSRYWVSAAAGLYELLIRTALEFNPPRSPNRTSDRSRLVLRSAFSHLERGRTLFLQRELANREPLPKGGARDTPLLKRFFRLRRQWLEAELRFLDREMTPDFPAHTKMRVSGVRDRLSAIEARYLRKLDGIRKKYGDPDYDPDRLPSPIEQRQLSEIVNRLSRAMETALVEYYISDRYLIVSVILPGLSVLKHAGITRAELDQIEAHWWRGYGKLPSERKSPPHDPIHWEGGYLHQVLDRLRPAVERAIESVSEWEATAQRRIRRVIIIPHRFLHLIPLHAVELSNGLMWGDMVRVQYAPSASVLLRLMDLRLARENQALEDHSRRVVAVAYASAKRPLIFHEPEARAVAEAAGGGEVIVGCDATRERVIEAIRDAAYIHFACHGIFDLKDPLNGGLHLAPNANESIYSGPLSADGQGTSDEIVQPDDGCMRLGEIFQDVRLTRARLVVLSACETGLTKVEPRHDEYIGLPAGFLHAGATTVVSALWPVTDTATWLLMCNFGRHVASGLSSAEALRSSQRELRGLSRESVLREVTAAAQKEPDPSRREQMLKEGRGLQGEFPFAGPYWWAGFTVNGLGDAITRPVKNPPSA
jgi:CHAT domain-containing protein/tetratricopeptide (TPR) repeat protein